MYLDNDSIDQLSANKNFIFNLTDYLVFRHIHEGRGDNIALFFCDRVFTYSELAKYIAKTIGFLYEYDIKEGDRVILLLEDSPAFVILFFSLLALGAIVIPINPVAHEELDSIFSSVDPSLIFTQNSFDFKSESTSVSKYTDLVIALSDITSDSLGGLEQLITTSDLVDIIPKTRGSSIAFCLCSSGTTGRPKIIPHRH